ncbi:ubiquitin-specific protease ubp2 [Xylographa soralifera]|nr:ubiquitin-specific protease ubp2 [Xylographa soralifera]
MSTQSNCPSSTKLLKTIGEKPLDPKRGNKVDTTAGKEKQPTAGQTAGQTTNQTTGQTTRQTTGQTAGKKAGKKAVGKKTVDTADLESDSSISRGISIKDDKQQQPGDGPHGETPVQRRRRKAVWCSYDEEYSLGVNCMEAAPKVQKIRNLIKQTMIGYIEVACPKCGKRESNRKYHLHIEAAPAVLAIHIRRFDWEMENDRLKKINDVVSFGPRLDLSKYYVPNKPVRKQSLKYKLVGVVNHQGTLKGGHYIATVKQPDIDEGPKTKPDKKTKRGRSSDAADAPADGKWMLADDGKISVSSLAEAQSTRETRGGFTPYILFYKRY